MQFQLDIIMLLYDNSLFFPEINPLDCTSKTNISFSKALMKHLSPNLNHNIKIDASLTVHLTMGSFLLDPRILHQYFE